MTQSVVFSCSNRKQTQIKFEFHHMNFAGTGSCVIHERNPAWSKKKSFVPPPSAPTSISTGSHNICRLTDRTFWLLSHPFSSGFGFVTGSLVVLGGFWAWFWKSSRTTFSLRAERSWSGCQGPAWGFRWDVLWGWGVRDSDVFPHTLTAVQGLVFPIQEVEHFAMISTVSMN